MRVVSLFSGAGGLDLGLSGAGHEVVWANDFDTDSCATYRRNLGDNIELAPIETVNPNDVPDAELMVGGFPCQGFSQANRQRRLEDPRNRLYWEFIRMLEAKQPSFFLAENVRGLTTLAAGEALRTISQGFENAGYRVTHRVLNAADYGVPQNRHRVIFLGIRSDLRNDVELKHPIPTHAVDGGESNRLLPHVTVAEALACVPDPVLFPDAVPNQEFSKYKFVERNFTGHRFTDPNKPSPTILARGNGGGGVNATPHPNGLRRMSVRESATLPTFPLSFEFQGKLGSAYRQVGNAVPVALAQQLGRALAEAEASLAQGGVRGAINS